MFGTVIKRQRGYEILAVTEGEQIKGTRMSFLDSYVFSLSE